MTQPMSEWWLPKMQELCDAVERLQAERDRLLEALRDLVGEPPGALTRPRSDSEEIPIRWGKIRKARAAVAAADEES
jgi:hypothetical protein